MRSCSATRTDYRLHRNTVHDFAGLSHYRSGQCGQPGVQVTRPLPGAEQSTGLPVLLERLEHGWRLQQHTPRCTAVGVRSVSVAPLPFRVASPDGRRRARRPKAPKAPKALKVRPELPSGLADPSDTASVVAGLQDPFPFPFPTCPSRGAAAPRCSSSPGPRCGDLGIALTIFWRCMSSRGGAGGSKVN